MRWLATLVTATVLTGGLIGAAPVGASVGTKDKKFCTAVKKLPSSVDALPAGTEGVDKKAAAKTAKSIRTAAKSAPRKVRKAMNTMADLYQRLANGDSITEVLSEDTIDFAKAAATFTVYFTKNCVDIPEVPQP